MIVRRDIFLKSINDQYPESSHNFYNALPFLSERMKIEKVEKLVANLQDKKKCFIHKKFKTSSESWISIKKGA